MEVFGADKVFVGHDTLDGRDDVFVAQADLQFLEVALEVWRRCDEHQRVVLFGNLVEVAGEEYLVGIESYALQVGGVVAQALEVLNAVVATHIPPDVVSLAHHYLGYGRCPRAATDNRYSTTVVHSLEHGFN